MMTNAAEYSIFSTILDDIEANPTILQEQKMKLSDEYSIFSPILPDVDEEHPTILQKSIDSTCTVPETLTLTDEEFLILQNQEREIWKSEMEIINGRGTSDRLGSCNPSYDREEDEALLEVLEWFIRDGEEQEKKKKKTQIDFTSTVPQTLTHSDLVDMLNQELAILKSEMETVKRKEEEVKYLADEVLEWLSRDDEISSDEDEEVNNVAGGGGSEIDEIIKEILEKIEKDGSYLERINEDYQEFGDFLKELVMEKLREKAVKEEEEISSWITNGEQPEEVENEVAEEKKKKKKKSTVKRTEQESIVTKRDYFGYKRRLYLIKKLRERDENLMNRRVKVARFGLQFSYLVAEYTFLTPNEHLVIEIEDYWICLKRFGVNEDDKGTSVIIGKLKEVFEIVMRKKMENKDEHRTVLDLFFRFDDYILLCTDAIRVLGKIVWGLRRNRSSDDERVKLSDLDSWFDDCQKVLMKIELKIAEMKQCVYKSVSADYESFSKSERFDELLREKLVKRFNADNGFRRSVIGSDVVEIWKSLFQAKVLQE